MNAFRKKIAGAAVGGSLLLGGATAVIAQSGPIHRKGARLQMLSRDIIVAPQFGKG